MRQKVRRCTFSLYAPSLQLHRFICILSPSCVLFDTNLRALYGHDLLHLAMISQSTRE
ncbi:unnamed protein product [Choristocarpus tenellus]